MATIRIKCINYHLLLLLQNITDAKLSKWPGYKNKQKNKILLLLFGFWLKNLNNNTKKELGLSWAKLST